jgi:formylglycine-generating enzyme required for sulfatase activity
MRLIPGGRVRLAGGDERFPSVPYVEVEVPPFWLDEHEVTNRQFAAFVAATGHVTEAERFGDSVVFEQGPTGNAWRLVPGANWRQPTGPGSSADLLPEHPVVHVALTDALAYAAWAKKRLPSEVEWEAAARGGALAWPFVWGQSYDPETLPANLWQGEFPLENRLLDGFAASAPVGRFAPNPFGLFDLAGNVWEWVQTSRGSGPLGHLHEPRTASMEPGLDEQIRGGSFLCAPNYCQGYRPTARQFKVATDASNNVGFRCAQSFSE